MNKIRAEHDVKEIVTGGARGADVLAEKYAKENGMALRLFPAEWDRYGRKAGYIRNPFVSSLRVPRRTPHRNRDAFPSPSRGHIRRRFHGKIQTPLIFLSGRDIIVI